MTRRDDEEPTIRESTVPDTRRGGTPPPPVTEFIEPTLTGPLFLDYTLIRQFPAAGGEADIWLVRKGHEQFILKHYRLGIEPKLDVLKQVSDIAEKHPHHLVRIFRYGRDEESQRWYEIQEYARNGTLKELIASRQVTRVQFRTIISEIATALAALHQRSILHLDLKPSNVLVRSVSPLNLILTDFGISTLLDTDLSRQITSTKGTPMYWAPEQLGNVVGREADYWSLGVIALEIAQGHHPFAGMNHNLILSTLSTRGISVPADLHPRTSLLLKGLLTRDPKKRWGQKEIAAWLVGRQNIPVHYEHEELSSRGSQAPYEFRGTRYAGLTELCEAFIHDPASWDDARRHLGRGYITRWLEKNERYGDAVELEKLAEEYKDEDERLLYSAARFNPEIPFSFLGLPLDIASIARYLHRYESRENDEREKRIISMLFSGELERIYATFTTITGDHDDTSLISRMFTWISANTRGIDEKRRLYEYLMVLHEREETGPPQDWDARAILRLVKIRDRYAGLGYDTGSSGCDADLRTAFEQAIRSESIEPDLLVAIAAVAEEFDHPEMVTPCLKKALQEDIRVVSLLYNRKTGINRFTLYSRLREEYETNLSSLSPDPWNEPVSFYRDLFFILLAGEDYPRALSVSERIIELDRTGGEGWAMRGVSLARIGRVREAEFFMTAKIATSSSSPLVWQIFGEYHLGSGNLPEAEKSFLTALEHDPAHAGSVHGLIRVYNAEKRHQDIIALCEKQIAAGSPDSGFLLRKGDAEFALGRIPQAVRTYEQYLTRVPENTGVLKCVARCQIKLKKNQDAAKTLEVLLEKGEADAQVFRLKAYLLLISGKIREAVDYLEKTLEEEPGDIWTLRIKADAHISLKEFAPALWCLDQVLATEPGNLTVMEKKGKILNSLGFSDQAAAMFGQVAEGGRLSAELCLQLGDAIRTMEMSRYGRYTPPGRDPDPQDLRWRVSHQYGSIWDFPQPDPDLIRRLTRSMDWYDQARSQGAEDAIIQNRRGIVLTILRNYEEAIPLFARASAEREHDAAPLTNHAVALVLSGEVDHGASVFLGGMSRFSKNPNFLDQCAGMYLLVRNDPKTALDLIGQALVVNTGRDPAILYHRMVILRALGREQEAEETAARVRAIDPFFDLSYPGT